MAKRTLSFDTKELLAIAEALGDSPEFAAVVKRMKSATKTIKIASRKNKGRQLQVDVCAMISDMISVPYVQGQDGPIMSRGMGQNGRDIILTGIAAQKFPYAVECKCDENMNLVKSIEQASANSTPGEPWLIFHRRKALKEDIVLMSTETFQNLFSKKGSQHE